MYKIYIFFLTLDSYRGEGIHCIRYIFPFNETHQEWERKNIYRIPTQSIFFHIVRDKNAYIYIYIYPAKIPCLLEMLVHYDTFDRKEKKQQKE